MNLTFLIGNNSHVLLRLPLLSYELAMPLGTSVLIS